MGFFHPGARPNEELLGALERCIEDAQLEFPKTGARLVRRLVSGEGAEGG
jgi:hypothetical protein